MLLAEKVEPEHRLKRGSPLRKNLDWPHLEHLNLVRLNLVRLNLVDLNLKPVNLVNLEEFATEPSFALPDLDRSSQKVDGSKRADLTLVDLNLPLAQPFRQGSLK